MPPASGRPGPGARVVSRPSLLALIIWPYMALIGVACVALGGIGVGIFGALLLLLCVLGFARMLRVRVWVDGSVLYSRGVRHWGTPIRLDRLRSARLSAFGRNSGRQLHLTDSDGSSLELEVTNTSVRRLWPILAEHLRWKPDVANDILRKRLARY